MAAEPTGVEAHDRKVLILQKQSSEEISQNEDDNNSSLSASELTNDGSTSTSVGNPVAIESLDKSNTSPDSKKPAGEFSNSSLSLAPGKDIDIRYDDVSLRGNKDYVDPEVQESRARLRERFMWAVTGLNGKPVSVEMMDRLSVSGVLRGIDKDGLMVHVENLQTPTAVHPWATLRLPDCLALHFPA